MIHPARFTPVNQTPQLTLCLLLRASEDTDAHSKATHKCQIMARFEIVTNLGYNLFKGVLVTV